LAAMESRERKKLYLVVGLLVLFVAVGYFRFFHGKTASFSQPERSAALPAVIDVPAVDLKAVPPAGLLQKTAADGPRAALRDIFAPVKKTVPGTATGNLPAAAAAPKPLPSLKLTGTILGGKRPLAVINGEMLRKGDKVAGFEVLSIAREGVTLAGGGRKVFLNIMTGPEERLP